MKVLDAYIARHVVVGTMLALAVLVSLVAVVTFVDDLGSVGRGRYGIGAAIEFMILTLPRQAFVLFRSPRSSAPSSGSAPWPRRRSSA